MFKFVIRACACGRVEAYKADKPTLEPRLVQGDCARCMIVKMSEQPFKPRGMAGTVDRKEAKAS
jgi:hypothetical protein